LHTGGRDVRIGTLLANRSWAGTERIIGHFINTVILRQRLSRTLTLREILAQARENTLAAHAHQNLPFEALVRVLEDKRKIERASLFQVMFIYHNSIFRPADLPGLTFSRPEPAWERADAGVTLTTCDLVFLLKETGEGLAGSVIFKSRVFDSAAAGAIRETFTRVLEMIIRSPEIKVADLAVSKAQYRKGQSGKRKT
jgi:non-ribosomal peptide synthetase component F